MKTIETFIKEIEGSEALQTEIKAIRDKDALAEYLKKNDCGFTVDEFAAYIKPDDEGELSDDDAEAVAGGSIRSLFRSLWRFWFFKF